MERATRRLAAVLAAAMAMATAAEARTARRGSDDPLGRRFFEAPASALARADGARLAFRFRRVDTSCDDGGVATAARDGLVRIAYQGDTLLMEELYLDVRPDRDPVPPTWRAVTVYSLATGEYVRSTSNAGGDELVFLDHWTVLPPIAYMALGLLAPPSALEGAEPRPEGGSADGGAGADRRRVAWIAPSGAEMRLDFDARGGGRLIALDALHPDGAERDRVRFHATVPGPAGGPERPTLVTQTRIAPSGCARQVLAWQSIGGSWAREAWDWTVAEGTPLADHRGRTGTIRTLETDRPLRLAELLTYSTDDARVDPAPPSVLRPSPPEPVRPSRAVGGSRLTWGAALLVLAAFLTLVTWRRNR